MAKYKTIKGFTIQSFSTDPVTSVAGSGTWASGGALNTGRFPVTGATNAPAVTTGLAFAGTATAALGFGGDSPGLPTATESFNGTSWTVVPATLTEGKESAAGFGLQTAAIFATGYAGPPAGPTGNTANVQSYNGTAWSEVNNVKKLCLRMWNSNSRNYSWGISTSL